MKINKIKLTIDNNYTEYSKIRLRMLSDYTAIQLSTVLFYTTDKQNINLVTVPDYWKIINQSPVQNQCPYIYLGV